MGCASCVPKSTNSAYRSDDEVENDRQAQPGRHRSARNDARPSRARRDSAKWRRSKRADTLEPSLSGADLDAVQGEMHRELLQISRLLEARHEALAQREAGLEQFLHEAEERITADLRREQAAAERAADEQLSDIRRQLDALGKEARRQHGIIAELRTGNRTLRDTVAALETDKAALQAQLGAAQNRAANLKTQLARQSAPAPSPPPPPASKPLAEPRRKHAASPDSEVLAELCTVLCRACSASVLGTEPRPALLDATQCAQAVAAAAEALDALAPWPRAAEACVLLAHACVRAMPDRTVARASLRRCPRARTRTQTPSRRSWRCCTRAAR